MIQAVVQAILTDIEGTTTPVSFVYEVLFPYAEQRLEEACARADSEPSIAAAVVQLRAEYDEDARALRDLPPFGDGAPYALYLMDQDRKSTGLKALQGLIWQQGYHDGTLRAQVFDDVPGALERWQGAGLRLRVYSSGSILAQKLLFAHTDHGDLTPYFEGYHDTTTGPKQEAASYRTIAAEYGLPGDRILFLSDVVAELDAAAGAGLQTALLRRPGNAPADPGSHSLLRDFNELHLPTARSPLPAPPGENTNNT